MKDYDVRLRQAALHIVLAEANIGGRRANVHWFRAGTLFHWCVRDCARRWDFPVDSTPVNATWDRMQALAQGIRQLLSEEA